jgi:hypothetical protein
MAYLLILHISLGVLLLLSFITRFIAVIAKKIDPKFGKAFVASLGFALVGSGVALSVVTKSPLTGTCLSALGIIAVIIALEFGLQIFVKSRLYSNK